MRALVNRLFRSRKAPRTPARRRPLGVEKLGDRIVPTVSTFFNNGTLNVMADNGNDNIYVNKVSNGVNVSDQGTFIHQDGAVNRIALWTGSLSSAHATFSLTSLSGTLPDTVLHGNSMDASWDHLTGNLSINPTAAGSTVNVWRLFGTNAQVTESAGNTSLSLPGVSKVIYNAGSQPGVSFCNNSSLPAEMHGGSALSWLYGGSGVNYFYSGPAAPGQIRSWASFWGGSGTNLYYPTPDGSAASYWGGTGTNVVFRNGPLQNILTPTGGTIGPVYTVGLDNARVHQYPDHNLRDTVGGIMVSLDPANNALVLSGPTAAGFQLVASTGWTDTVTPVNGQYQHSFSATGTVYLKTGTFLDGNKGGLPLPLGNVPLTITTSPWVLSAPVGPYSGITLAGGLPLNSNSSSSPLHGFSTNYGLSLQTGGANWGIALGSDLRNMQGLSDAPLDNAIPYLYFNTSTGDTVNFGGMSAGTPNPATFSVVFDPADPMLYLEGSYNDYKLAFGVSYNGDLAYRPKSLPDGVVDPEIFGNIYSQAGASLGDLPVSVAGETVIALDPNHTGHPLGISPLALNQALNHQRSLSSLFTTGLSNIAVGFNGTVSVGADAYGIPFSMNVGQGSAFYEPTDGIAPGVLAFRGQSTNPFAGIPVLQNFNALTGYDFQGYLKTDKEWGFSLDVRNNSLFGYPMSDISASASSSSSTVQLHASMGGLFGLGQVYLDGSYNWSTETFTLDGGADFSLDAGVMKLDAHAGFHLSVQGTQSATFGVDLSAYGQIGSDDDNWHIGLDAHMTLTTNWQSAGFDLWANVYTGVTIAGDSHDASLLSLDINNHGFDTTIAGHHLHVSW